MDELKRNQILIELSEDKKKLTITAGCLSINPMVFDVCPAKKPSVLISGAIKTFEDGVGLLHIPEWKPQVCGYEGGECKDCN